MAMISPEMVYKEEEIVPISDTIRRQLTGENGVMTRELTVVDQALPVGDAYSMAEYVPDISDPNISVTQDLIGVADTGKSLFGIVRASVVSHGQAATRLFLTEMPHANEQSSHVVHEFAPNPAGYHVDSDGELDTSHYDGVQPMDMGQRSRLQMMLDDKGTLHMRIDPSQRVDDPYLIGNPVTISESFGHAVETPPQDWAVPTHVLFGTEVPTQVTY
jgi:hypothetical protein